MIVSAGTFGGAADAQPGIVRSEFIFETAPFRECHASTIVESRGTLLAAWFGGTREKNPDVCIWLSRHEGGRWTPPEEVANGMESQVKRYPCWNPVLFQPKDGPLMLFYKVGPSPDSWWGMLMTSADGGRTWSDAQRLPGGILGPIKNKPVQLSTGDIVCPSSTEDKGWRVHFERTPDLGRTWQRTGPVNDGREFGAIQPSILVYDGTRLQALGRTQQRRVFQIWSEDGGRSWGPMGLTSLPNPNSGIDAVTLTDGRQLLVYNHTTQGRSPLNVSVSADGRDWKAAFVLESGPGEYSYPAVIQTSDSLVHITYTWKRRRIRHVVLDAAKLYLQPLSGGEWPDLRK
jgi:predicted neuraminidase